LTLAWVPEALGGAGAELSDGFAVLREAGRFALGLPLAETLLAGGVVSKTGPPAPPRGLAFAPAGGGEGVAFLGEGTLSGALRAIPFVKGAKHLAVLAARKEGGLVVALVDAAQAHSNDTIGIGGDPLNSVNFSAARPAAVKDAPAGLDEQALLLIGAV